MLAGGVGGSKFTLGVRAALRRLALMLADRLLRCFTGRPLPDAGADVARTE